MPLLHRLAILLAIPVIFSRAIAAQVPDPVVAAEAPRPGAGHHYIGVGAETVNPADGSLSFDLPLQPPTGRQISFRFGIRFAGTEQYFLRNWPTNGTLQWFPNGYYGQQPYQIGAWSYDVPLLTASTSLLWSVTSPNNGCPNGVCTYGTNTCYGNDGYVFRGLDGNQYSLALGSVFPDPKNFTTTFCPSSPSNLKGPSNNHGVLSYYQSSTVTTVVDPSGTTYQFPVGSGQPPEPANPPGDPVMWGDLATTITDRNGNQLTLGGGGYKDSTGRTAVSWSGIGNTTTGDQITVSGLGPVTVKWTTVPVSFPETGHNLGTSPNTCTLSGALPGTSPIKVVSEIDLPNSQKYTFQYDGTYGKVSKITFPDGGYVRYVWGLYASGKGTHAAWNQGTPPTPLSCDFIFDIPAVTDRYVSYDGTTEVLHQQFSYALPNWGSGPTWTTRQTTVTSTDLLTSQITKTIYTYGPATTDNNVWVTSALYSKLVAVETNVLYQDGAGKTLKEVNKTWLNPHVMLAEQTILYDSAGNRSVGSATYHCYDANEQVTNLYEYGFQTEGSKPADPTCYSSPTKVGSLNTTYIGPLRRQTTTAYHPFFSWNPPSWTGTHIVTAPDSSTVADGSNVTASQTLFTYDQNVLQTSGAINLTNTGTTRANATTVRHLTSGSTYATITYNYFDTGQVASMSDACGNTTCSDMTGTNHTATFSYADNYASGTGTPTGQTNAYLTQVTHPNTGVAHVEKFTWGFNDGLLRTTTDQNNLVTTYAYADPLLRLTSITAPDGGQTTVSYNDTAPSPTMTVTKTINASQSITTATKRDGMGHTVQTQLTSDPQGTVYADTTFNGLGQVWKQSNPYRTGTDPTTSSGTTIFAYDALTRKLSETHPDGSVVTTAYCGPSTLATDPTGKWRRSRTDGLGFLVEVDEPNSTTATVASTGCPGTGEPIWVTSYGHDTLGNLTSALQNGSRSRSFTYDSISRMLTSANPETGTITYTYDANSNVSTKNDARNITTTYGYDVLNRTKSVVYSNSDPSVAINYDESNCLGLAACQNVGQKTSMTDAAGSEAWSYQTDSANKRSVHVNQRTNTSPPNNLTKTSTYYLDLAGNLTSVVYPSGRTVNYTFDAASRPMTAVDSANGITYATAPATPLTGCLANAVCYTPQGSIYSMSIGKTSTFTGLNFSETFNNRLQPNEVKASSTGGNAMDITYNFVDPVSTKNASHVYGITNNLDTTRSQSFTYDQLNRISSAQTSSTFSTSPSHCWGETYTVDTWGNLQTVAATTNSAYTGCSQESGFAKTPDTNNHLSGLTYDAAGNTQTDGTFTYTWDGESQLKSAGGVNYIYDGQGRRVSKSNGKFYWYGSGGEILTETDASGNSTTEYIFFGGKRVAELAPNTQGSPGTGTVTVSGSEQSIGGAAATSGTGSVTFSGTLQSKQVLSQAATAGTGSVTLNGSLQSIAAVPATSGTGSVTIYGSERDNTFDPCQPHSSCPRQIPDTGYVSITVNGFTASYTYGYPDTTSTVAAGLASALNASSSPVTASANGAVVTLTTKATGSSTNYSLSSSCNTTQTSWYSGCSFSGSASGSTLTGGANGKPAVYDSGSCTITVNSHGDSTSWSGSGTTSSSIASALASSINGDGGASISAGLSGSTVNLTAKTTGAGTNYALSSSCSYDTSHFSSPSFSASNSGSALTGGRDATYTTVYDSGSSTITVNGHADSVSWSGSGTTTSSIASGLASAINADSSASVSASASGNAVNLTAKTTGASTNYSLSSSSTYDSTDFSGASFSSSNSGSTLTGGRDTGATTYDSGNVWITINGTQYSVSYGQGSSASSVASALASAISTGSLANASASGASISLTAKSNGYATNYSLSSGSSTSQPGSFSSPSFTASSSGSTLTGGRDSIFYYVEDMLGTSRVLTTDTGIVCYDADFYPYGGERAYTNTCPQNYKFEGKERDAETGNDDFGARYYSNRFGRWLSADWSNVPAPVPYANLTNPQTLNLYAMVSDDPETFADLDGHCCDPATLTVDLVNALIEFKAGVDSFDKNYNTDPRFRQEFQNAMMTSTTLGTSMVMEISSMPGGEGERPSSQTSSSETQAVRAAEHEAVEGEAGTGPGAGSKSYQTYTKENPETGAVYSGRTSGTETPQSNVAARDAGHHMSEKGFGPAKLDRSSSNPAAIRGREQQLIKHHGGAQSEGGTSGNAINGVSPRNKNAKSFDEAAKKEFPPL